MIRINLLPPQSPAERKRRWPIVILSLVLLASVCSLSLINQESHLSILRSEVNALELAVESRVEREGPSETQRERSAWQLLHSESDCPKSQFFEDVSLLAQVVPRECG